MSYNFSNRMGDLGGSSEAGDARSRRDSARVAERDGSAPTDASANGKVEPSAKVEPDATRRGAAAPTGRAPGSRESRYLAIRQRLYEELRPETYLDEVAVDGLAQDCLRRERIVRVIEKLVAPPELKPEEALTLEELDRVLDRRRAIRSVLGGGGAAAADGAADGGDHLRDVPGHRHHAGREGQAVQGIGEARRAVDVCNRATAERLADLVVSSVVDIVEAVALDEEDDGCGPGTGGGDDEADEAEREREREKRYGGMAKSYLEQVERTDQLELRRDQAMAEMIGPAYDELTDRDHIAAVLCGEVPPAPLELDRLYELLLDLWEHSDACVRQNTKAAQAIRQRLHDATVAKALNPDRLARDGQLQLERHKIEHLIESKRRALRHLPRPCAESAAVARRPRSR